PWVSDVVIPATPDRARIPAPAPTTRAGESGLFSWLVSAPHFAKRVADLTYGRSRSQRLAHDRQHVGRALGRRADLVEAPLDEIVVTVPAQRGQPGRLLGLDRWVYPQRFVRLLLVQHKGIHPDDH